MHLCGDWISVVAFAAAAVAGWFSVDVVKAVLRIFR